MLVLVVILAALGFLLTCCPANRDGMPGQLARAMEETASAARSGALALEMSTNRRETAELTAVQQTAARTESSRRIRKLPSYALKIPSTSRCGSWRGG